MSDEGGVLATTSSPRPIDLAALPFGAATWGDDDNGWTVVADVPQADLDAAVSVAPSPPPAPPVAPAPPEAPVTRADLAGLQAQLDAVTRLLMEAQ